ncbi:MAG: sigma-54 dependent transcriptional regulator [Thermodesulfovibrionales bacterium]|jgi:DNA-binding NtrC family response regulator
MHSSKPYVTIIDDEPHFSESLRMALEDTFEISVVGTLKGARESLRERIPDAILLDMRLPDGDGIEYLQGIKDIKPIPVIIVMTAYATVENAVMALKDGAVDYFIKPFDIEKLKRELNVYLENRLLHEKIVALDREIRKITPPFETFGIGKMKEIVDRAPLIAPLDIPILLKGETGTGKEKLAGWIHSLAGLEGQMVTINCAALPRDIIESELFGYTKGAFSGAGAYKEGLIEKAESGTLFLDEIGELSEDVQAKFLRVLEGGVYYKLGDTRERRARFRLISATSKDLYIPSSNFRQDLFYRINGITFELPPLRERRDDIPLLVAVFLKEANYAYKKDIRTLTPKAMEYLTKYTWPGNIRELQWCIKGAVATASGDIVDASDISLGSNSEGTLTAGCDIDYSVPLEDALSEIEKKYIKRALASSDNNKTEAARILGISARVLHYKIKKYNL